MVRNGGTQSGGGKRREVAKDQDAADLIRRLRTNEGLTPEGLAAAIRDKAMAAGIPASRVSISGDTIRLIERTGREPGVRVKYALAFYFNRRPGHIWKRDALFLEVAA